MARQEIVALNLIRGPIERRDYASEQGKPNPEFSFIDCGLGHSPFEYPGQVNDVLGGITKDLLREYPADPYAKRLGVHVRERFGLNKKTEVFFGGCGSYGLLASIFSDFVSSDMVKSSGLELVGYGPQFTNVVVLADRARIPYMAVQSPLLEPIEVKISDLCDYLQRRKGPAVVYVDNPNNPTGDVINGESLKALVMLTQKRGDLLIVDEAFGDSIPDGMSAFGLMENANNMIVTRSLSKVIGLASPRLGYMAMSRPLAEVYKNIELVFSVDTFTGLVGEVALEPVMLAEFLPDVRKKTELIKRQMVRVLQEVGIDVFESHPMVSILLARGEGNFYKTLLDLGIGTEDGATFKPTHENMDSSLVRMRIPGSLGRVAEIRKRLEKI